jgi:pimeloyl-ACP methyl ester carboxylesterase
MSKETYLRLVAVSTLVQSLLTLVAAWVAFGSTPTWQVLLAALLTACGGAALFNAARRVALVSCGVVVMSLALGALIGWAAALYHGQTVIRAVLFAGAVITLMCLAAAAWPPLFEGRRPYLTAGLATVLAAVTLAPILSARSSRPGAVQALGCVAIAAYALYIAYSWTRAASGPRTLANAVRISGLTIVVAAVSFLRSLDTTGAQATPSGRHEHN